MNSFGKDGKDDYHKDDPMKAEDCQKDGMTDDEKADCDAKYKMYACTTVFMTSEEHCLKTLIE